MKGNKGFTLVELIIVIAIVMIITGITITGLFLGSGGLGSYSDGDCVGIITQFSHKGILWTTWEGEMVMGGIRAGGNVANVWEFSVTDQTIVAKLQETIASGKTVKLHYKQILVARPWNGSTTYYVDSVVPIIH